VKAILAAHGEFGRGGGAALSSKPGPARSETRPAEEWFARVEKSVDPKKAPVVHGRLLIAVLATLDRGLQEYLAADGFLDAIKKEIAGPFSTLLRGQPAPGVAPARSVDPAPFQLDNPAEQDQLERRSFVRALAIRLDRIWNEYSRSRAPGSFIVHLNGPWGAGKTSLLNLLREALQVSRERAEADSAPAEASQWIVVNFNAWQHQRLDPPWWSLLNVMYHQACEQRRVQDGQFWRVSALRVWENWWRIKTGSRDSITVTSLVLLAAALLYWPLSWVFPVAQAEGAGAVTGALSLITMVVSTAVLVSRSLLPGSARAARSFVQSSGDPMTQVCRHFRDLITAIERPVMIFIDDLDRCQAPYVVHLLEGIQTLLNDPRVLYVVAADRRWLCSCYEAVYDGFVPSVNEPGRRLGELFLEKVFELSVAVPRVSPEVQGAYFHSLLQTDAETTTEQIKERAHRVRSEFAGAKTEQEVLDKLCANGGADIVEQQLRRQAAVERLVTAEAEQGITCFLERFAPLLEPNPRALKRFINAYAVLRDLTMLTDANVLRDVSMRKRLALWTILSVRWPAVADYLSERAAGREGNPDPEMLALLGSEPVQNVWNGHGVNAVLDLPSVGVFTGARSGIPPAKKQ
jgi:hypothetical protein